MSSVSVITDKIAASQKGFGFVELDDKAKANEAIRALNETELSGRAMRVNEAKPRERRPGGGSRY